MGEKGEDLKWLSAWNAKGGDAYVRTARTVTQSMQNQLSDKIRDSEQLSIGEAEFIDRVKHHLVKRGMEIAVANVVAGYLRSEIEKSSPEPQCNDAERGSGSEHEKKEAPMKVTFFLPAENGS